MTMNYGTEARSSGPMRHRIDVEYELDEAPEREVQGRARSRNGRAHLGNYSWKGWNACWPMSRTPPAPKGLAERILTRIRLVMSEDIARLPTEAHEAIAQAYALMMLSTLPVLLSASWAVAHTARGEEGEGLSSLLRQLTEILQSTADDLHEMRTHKYAPGAAAPELVEMMMALIPLYRDEGFRRIAARATIGFAALGKSADGH